MLLFATASCATTAQKKIDAASVFAHSESCPVERVSISEEESPSAREVLLADSHPPQEVLDDPGRLDMWLADHESRGRDGSTKFRQYSAAGCDATAEITCADHWFGLTRCSTHQLHVRKYDEAISKMNQIWEDSRRIVCSLHDPIFDSTCKDPRPK